MADIYIICPVRRATDEDRRAMEAYAEALEAEGNHVHLPHRDVDQTNDDGGVRICLEHREAMRLCNEVHVWLLPGQGLSEGSFFDLGMAFMLAGEFADGHWGRLKFKIANGRLDRTEHKSFQNVLHHLIGDQDGNAG